LPLLLEHIGRKSCPLLGLEPLLLQLLLCT